ncbi:MAG: HU family DNA-binding protein, partial [Myxococcota bacterium]
RIEIRGFGSFSVRHRRARMGRNPKTGDSIAVPPKRVPFFTVGHELKDRVDAGRHKHPITDGKADSDVRTGDAAADAAAGGSTG